MKPALPDFGLLEPTRGVDEVSRCRRPGDRAPQRRQVVRAALADGPAGDRHDCACVPARFAERNFVENGARDHVHSIGAGLPLERCEADRGHPELAALDGGEGLVSGPVEALPRELNLDVQAAVARL